MMLLEAVVEGKSCAYAKSLGWLTPKFKSPNRRSVPDRIFISPTGIIIFIEFKATGKKPTPAQSREIERLRKNGCFALYCDSIEDCKILVDMFHVDRK